VAHQPSSNELKDATDLGTVHYAADVLDRFEALKRQLEALTPGGSEFHDSPQRCILWIKERLDNQKKLIVKNADLRRQLQAANAGLEKCASDFHAALQPSSWTPIFPDALQHRGWEPFVWNEDTPSEHTEYWKGRGGPEVIDSRYVGVKFWYKAPRHTLCYRVELQTGRFYVPLSNVTTVEDLETLVRLIR